MWIIFCYCSIWRGFYYYYCWFLGKWLEFVFYFLCRFAADERETQTTARSEAKAQTESRTGSDAIENTRSCDAHSVSVAVAVSVGVAAVDDGVSFVTCKERERETRREREGERAWVSWRLPPSAYQFHCTLSLALRVVVFSPSLSITLHLSLFSLSVVPSLLPSSGVD